MLQKFLCLVGLLCFCFGGCALESDSLVIPVLLCLFGGGLALATYKSYEL